MWSLHCHCRFLKPNVWTWCGQSRILEANLPLPPLVAYANNCRSDSKGTRTLLLSDLMLKWIGSKASICQSGRSVGIRENWVNPQSALLRLKIWDDTPLPKRSPSPSNRPIRKGSFDFCSGKYCMRITGVMTNHVCETWDATLHPTLKVVDLLAFEMAHITCTTGVQWRQWKRLLKNEKSNWSLQ